MKMNKKAQLDEINPAYLGLSLLAGAIAFFVVIYADKQMPTSLGIFWKLASGIGATIITYLYLSFTDR